MITKIIKDNLKEWDVEVDIVKSLDTVRYTAYDLKLLNRKTDIFKHEPILNDLTLAVKSPYSIAYDSSRLYEDSTIRISIPKSDFKPVNIADLINNIDKKVYKLPIIFGLDVENNIVVKDLYEVGHILMAGATGSGKSMFAHTILYTLMSLYEPDYVSFYLVDMKRIEFGAYKGSPYLQADPLMGLYDEFNNVIHTLEGYIQSKPDSKYTVILIDTFSDLICHNKEKYEDIIKRLSVKENTFIVMWDSRPSTDVYTPNIFDVFGTKIVFNMVSEQQSKFFCGLDIGSKLLGKGDAVITGKSFENPTRVQCPYISDTEIEKAVQKGCGIIDNQSNKLNSKEKNKQFTILLIDDEDDIREMNCNLLKVHGYNVIQLPDPREISIVLESQKINMIILDIMMPYRNGIEVLKYLRQNKKYKNTPIIMSSLIDNMAIIKQCFSLGADWYLRITQLTPDEYIKEIEEFIPLPKRRILAQEGKELKYVAFEDLKIEFGGPNHPEKDEKLIDLMDKAHSNLIPVFLADVPIKNIKPNCSFKPDLDGKSNWRKIFHDDFENGRPHFLHIYPEGEYFIMSDDYISYYSYLNEGFVIVPCIIFGDVDNPEVTNKKKIIWDYQSFREP